MATAKPSTGLVDDESEFLRQINEGYRTWLLRDQKIKAHLRVLGDPDQVDSVYKLEARVQQLKAMTIGPLESDKAHGDEATGHWLRTMSEGEDLLKKLRGLVSERPVPGESDGPGADLATVVDELQRLLGKAGEELDGLLENRLNAEFDLQECEEKILAEWSEKKAASETWMRRHSALTGMRLAIRAALARVDKAALLPEARTKSGGAAASEGAFAHEGDGEDEDLQLLMDQHDENIRLLSEVLAEGADDQEREEILKREHPGSREHPHNCRACHFQGGLCWKGLACSFCHICPKPKRKSKHQRDVDKRRQERYQQVKDDLGLECLDQMTKIDEGRRVLLSLSEDLKRRMKDAYTHNRHGEIRAMKEASAKLQRAVDEFQNAVPLTEPSVADEEEEEAPRNPAVAASSGGPGRHFAGQALRLDEAGSVQPASALAAGSSRDDATAAWEEELWREQQEFRLPRKGGKGYGAPKFAGRDAWGGGSCFGGGGFGGRCGARGGSAGGGRGKGGGCESLGGGGGCGWDKSAGGWQQPVGSWEQPGRMDLRFSSEHHGGVSGASAEHAWDGSSWGEPARQAAQQGYWGYAMCGEGYEGSQWLDFRCGDQNDSCK